MLVGDNLNVTGAFGRFGVIALGDVDVVPIDMTGPLSAKTTELLTNMKARKIAAIAMVRCSLFLVRLRVSFREFHLRGNSSHSRAISDMYLKLLPRWDSRRRLLTEFASVFSRISVPSISEFPRRSAEAMTLRCGPDFSHPKASQIEQ
jgi:hypothetical protein